MSNLEVSKSIQAGGVRTNYHDQGAGDAVVLIHGSGPGVTAWANWRLLLPELSKDRRVIAPDMLGFGYTERPTAFAFDKEAWVGQVIDLIDALGLEHVDIVGNSFGGGIALATAIRYPERVRRLVLMGSAGALFEMTAGLEATWGYTPSLENMRSLLDIFAYDRSLVTDELAELRYQASVRPGFQDSFSALFPAPRQRWVDALACDEEALRALPNETLVIHGREDRVVPVESSIRLSQWIKRSQLHVFGCCGHWAQIEHASRFARLVRNFLSEE